MPHQIIKGKGPLAGHSKTKGVLKKARLAITKAGEGAKKAWQSDKNPIQAQYNKQANIANSDKNQKSTAGGRIQKRLVKAGFSKTELRHKVEATQKKKNEKARIAKMRKNDPEAYRKLKKKQRKAANEKAFRRRGVDPSDY